MQSNQQSPINPISGAAGQAEPTAVNADIVSNIPIKRQANLTPVSEDDELDQIMQDVGHDMKKADQKPSKKRFFEFKHHPKVKKTKGQDVPFEAQPIRNLPPAPSAPPSHPPANPAKPQPKTAPAKAQEPSSAPVLAISLAVLITGALIAAAYFAYK